MQIILIDDDNISNLINSKMIGKYSQEVNISVFVKAADAIEKLPELIVNEKTIVFLDINMPEMNGWEFLDTFDFKGADCKVYMLTSSINENDKHKATSYPIVQDFISKPLSFDKLSKIF